MATVARTAEPEYTNGRIRVRPDQIEFLDRLLHLEWVKVSRARAQVKEVVPHDNDLINLMNRELRLIKTIQDEVRRAKEDMGLE